MDINNKLNEKLLSQSFVNNEHSDDEIERFKLVAATYAATENSIAVLSDLKEEMSYIYYGGIANLLGIGKKGTFSTIQSIWEKEIFITIKPSDLDKRNLDELQFFHFMKNIPAEERGDYCLTTSIMMNTCDGYIPVNHRISYIGSYDNETISMPYAYITLLTSIIMSHTFVIRFLVQGLLLTDRIFIRYFLNVKKRFFV